MCFCMQMFLLLQNRIGGCSNFRNHSYRDRSVPQRPGSRVTVLGCMFCIVEFHESITSFQCLFSVDLEHRAMPH